MSEMREFYHSFSLLGLPARQKPDFYRVNQRCKEPHILGYLLEALAKTRGTRVEYQPSVLELFCADAYYGFLAKRFGAGHVLAIDNDREALEQAAVIRDALALEIDLRQADIVGTPLQENFDIVLCTGRLYHISDPGKLVRDLRQHVKHYLVVQSVVSLESKDHDYFISPAPGWPHGCRFSERYFLRMLREANFHVLGYGFNHLEGNERLCDRGSAYALCGVRPEKWPA